MKIYLVGGAIRDSLLGLEVLEKDWVVVGSSEEELTKKGVMSGNNVSHAKNRTRRKFEPNLHNHRLWSEVQKKWVTLKLSTKGLRIIDKFGLDKALEKYDIR